MSQVKTVKASGSPAAFTGDKVAILLCTYHGQSYLAEQLDSFEAQTFKNWSVFASDDGSTDDTHAILEAYRKRWCANKLSIHFGPAEGFVPNFLSLACNASIQADYYAYSDQDDIWEANKLQRALEWLRSVPAHVPALYGSRTRIVNKGNEPIGMSPLFTKPPCFANALMQNIAGGNTMVFNEAARQLLRQVGDKVVVVSHDWWVYLVVSGCGGEVFYDPYPSVRYRQHDSNLIGINRSWKARMARMQMVAKGNFKHWNDVNIAAIQVLRNRLTPANQTSLQLFALARTQPLLRRLWMLKRSGVRRQSLPSNIALLIAVFFGKI
jgi:glycosyltransferase involved in cell wall biosynthesis